MQILHSSLFQYIFLQIKLMLHKDLSQFKKHDNKWNPISQRPLSQKCFLVRKFWFLWSGFHLGFTESIKVLLSHLFFHQWPFFLSNSPIVFCIISWTVHLMEPFFFSLYFILVSRKCLHPISFPNPLAIPFSSFLLLFSPTCVSDISWVLASFLLYITFLGYPSSVFSPELSSYNIQMPFSNIHMPFSQFN